MSNSLRCSVCGQAKVFLKVCRTCANVRSRKYKAENANKIRAYAASYVKTASSRLVDSKRSSAKHAAKAGDRLAAKLEKQRTLPLRRAAAKVAWKERNPGTTNESTARRFATKMQATPAWADREVMKDLYTLAAIYIEFLGEPVHVDHVVPLRSKKVCGLHTPANLTLLIAAENIRKGNRWWPEMP